MVLFWSERVLELTCCYAMGRSIRKRRRYRYVGKTPLGEDEGEGAAGLNTHSKLPGEKLAPLVREIGWPHNLIIMAEILEI